MGFIDKYPYTDFHELNLDWFINKLKELEIEKSAAVNIGTVQYYYIDQIYGSNDNDGLTEATAFKTLAHGLNLINQGVKDIGFYICTDGTYIIPHSLRTVTNATIHIYALHDADVTIAPEVDRFVAYDCHFSWYGSANMPLKVNIPTFRLDGGQFWADYVHFVTRVGSNGCSCRFRWCEFTETSEFMSACIILQEPKFHGVLNQKSHIVVRSSTCELRDSITVDDIYPGTDSRIFELHSALLGVEPDTVFNSITNKYDYFARTYSGIVYARYDERNGMEQIANKAVYSSGYELNDLNAANLWFNRAQPGDDADDFELGMTYCTTGHASQIANLPFTRVACIVNTTRAYNNSNYLYQECISWGTGYETVKAVRHGQSGSWSEWYIIRNSQESNQDAITVIGDSLSSGYISADDGSAGSDYYEESWPAFLSRKIGCKYYISGRGGIETGDWYNNSVYGRTGMFSRLPITPVYFIALGTNDCTHGVTQATFEANYKNIINAVRAKAPNSIIICLKLWRTSGHYQTFNTYIDNVLALYSSDTKITSIDITTEVNTTPISSHEWSGHFDSIGYRYIADEIDKKVLAFTDAHPDLFRRSFNDLIRTNYHTNDGFPYAL